MDRISQRSRKAAGRSSRGGALDSGVPMPPRHRIDWISRLGLGGMRTDPQRLAAARIDFAEALDDISSSASASLQSRIAVARSLHELWHLREEAFSLISRRHSQGVANDRLASLKRHFA